MAGKTNSRNWNDVQMVIVAIALDAASASDAPTARRLRRVLTMNLRPESFEICVPRFLNLAAVFVAETQKLLALG